MRSCIFGAAALALAACGPSPQSADANAAGAASAGPTSPAGAHATASPSAQPPVMGEMACYGSSGPLIGLGHVLLADGAYHDLDGGNPGHWRYDAAAATITFVGGFMDGQVGQGVSAHGYQIATTSCEPSR